MADRKRLPRGPNDPLGFVRYAYEDGNDLCCWLDGADEVRMKYLGPDAAGPSHSYLGLLLRQAKPWGLTEERVRADIERSVTTSFSYAFEDLVRVAEQLYDACPDDDDGLTLSYQKAFDEVLKRRRS